MQIYSYISYLYNLLKWKKKKNFKNKVLLLNIDSKRDTLNESEIINPDISRKGDIDNKLTIIEEESKNYIEDMKKGTFNILVAVRCRPLNLKEKEISDIEIVKVLDKNMLVLIDPYEYNGHSDIFKNRSREQNYAFDIVFDKTCSQVKQISLS